MSVVLYIAAVIVLAIVVLSIWVAIRIAKTVWKDYRFFKQMEINTFNEGIKLSAEDLRELIKKEEEDYRQTKERLGRAFPLSHERARLSGLRRALKIKQNNKF